MRIWVIFIVGGLITFSLRASFIVLGDRFRLPESIQRSLVYVAPAAFAAIAIPAAMGDDGFGSLAPPTPEVLAAVIAGAVIYFSRNMIAGLIVGMGSLWILQAFGL